MGECRENAMGERGELHTREREGSFMRERKRGGLHESDSDEVPTLLYILRRGAPSSLHPQTECSFFSAILDVIAAAAAADLGASSQHFSMLCAGDLNGNRDLLLYWKEGHLNMVSAAEYSKLSLVNI